MKILMMLKLLLGTYKYVGNELIFKESRVRAIHSAAQTVSGKGMETLMDNVAERLNLEIVDKKSVDELIEILE